MAASLSMRWDLVPGGALGCDPRKRACRAFSDTTGPISRDLDANDTMAAFFARYALP